MLLHDSGGIKLGDPCTQPSPVPGTESVLVFAALTLLTKSESCGTRLVPPITVVWSWTWLRAIIRKAGLENIFVLLLVPWGLFMTYIFHAHLLSALFLVKIASKKNGSSRLPGGKDIRPSKLWRCPSLSPTWCFKKKESNEQGIIRPAENALRAERLISKRCRVTTTVSLFCLVHTGRMQSFSVCLGRGGPLERPPRRCAYVGSRRASSRLCGPEIKGRSFLKTVGND